MRRVSIGVQFLFLFSPLPFKAEEGLLNWGIERECGCRDLLLKSTSDLEQDSALQHPNLSLGLNIFRQREAS